MLQISDGEEDPEETKAIQEHKEEIQDDDVFLVKIRNAKTKQELNDIYAGLGEEEQGKYIGAIQDRGDELNNPKDGLFEGQ